MRAKLFEDINIEQKLLLPNGEEIVQVNNEVMPGGKKAGNVFRVQKNGLIVWQLEIPEGVNDLDYLTNIEFLNLNSSSKILIGYRVSGVEIEADLETGKILSEELVK